MIAVKNKDISKLCMLYNSTIDVFCAKLQNLVSTEFLDSATTRRMTKRLSIEGV